MPRRFFSFTLILALLASGPTAFAAGSSEALGQIAGTARDSIGQPMPNALVRVRNIEIGPTAGSTVTGAAGQFAFKGLNRGLYVVEVVGATGRVVATSALISLTSGQMAARSVGVTAPAVSTAQAGPFTAAFFTSTVGIVTAAAVASGVIFAVYQATKDDTASTSR